MELKLTLQGVGTNEVLRSNRTFMELKLIHDFIV